MAVLLSYRLRYIVSRTRLPTGRLFQTREAVTGKARLPTVTVDDRAFPVAAARVWNSLPDLVTSAPSVAVFRSRLKTHLFNISFPCDCTVPAQ